MEELMSYFKYLTRENLNLLVNEADEDLLSDILYPIFCQWEEQHCLDTEDQGDGTLAISCNMNGFFHASNEYDNSAWLTETIAKKSNGAFVI